ncbi:4-amino-4-deoxy-L-arabinose-phosphoundecaprenol flippase subunit ArnF [Shewanella intestini]|uniref:Probable 4-amino-4-deoxy-L-arabinose-phosphoundecaprenol flippase subunit ArnF n=1 Tax=Shewanella intestini TaxID=2017544 RepID=A0ABS5I464_9GAMM|nr:MULTISPECIES: 4-amino-4-deoxy-L-arabinose-phosphoundecaprenol flippase subunit ArnF [Shewanella]MBR9728827.1 4-amino-4-deoxy-L-arabinose-phospho-UDP flippase [Shewanella intestini]MRG37107.1 4-amino-4-deoxy-L-arabinose-phospho-UDP flippase [Shewanella sp. XMDDZSB0408]
MVVNAKNNQGIVLALVSVMLISTAQLAMKWGMGSLNQLWPQLQLLVSPLELLAIIKLSYISLSAVLVGLCCYALSMLCWVMALKHLPLSTAYPILSLSYVLVYLGAISLPWLNEAVSSAKMLGIGFILLGLYLAIPQKRSIH